MRDGRREWGRWTLKGFQRGVPSRVYGAGRTPSTTKLYEGRKGVDWSGRTPTSVHRPSYLPYTGGPRRPLRRRTSHHTTRPPPLSPGVPESGRREHLDNLSRGESYWELGRASSVQSLFNLRPVPLTSLRTHLDPVPFLGPVPHSAPVETLTRFLHRVRLRFPLHWVSPNGIGPDLTSV